jgi:hypothetical protein
MNHAQTAIPHPFAYRDLDECLMLIDGYVEEIERMKVIAYMGHL